eukprot:COSAG02_NODE_7_length_64539_cov_120.393482_1_plen_91_part_00
MLILEYTRGTAVYEFIMDSTVVLKLAYISYYYTVHSLQCVHCVHSNRLDRYYRTTYYMNRSIMEIYSTVQLHVVYTQPVLTCVYTSTGSE